jgi:hypothetical protein
MFQLIRYRIGNRDAAHRVVPPKLFCASLEVTPEYWRDSIPERAIVCHRRGAPGLRAAAF